MFDLQKFIALNVLYDFNRIDNKDDKIIELYFNGIKIEIDLNKSVPIKCIYSKGNIKFTSTYSRFDVPFSSQESINNDDRNKIIDIKDMTDEIAADMNNFLMSDIFKINSFKAETHNGNCFIYFGKGYRYKIEDLKGIESFKNAVNNIQKYLY